MTDPNLSESGIVRKLSELDKEEERLRTLAKSKGYAASGKHIHFGTSALVCGVLVGAFWFLGRQHDKGPLGLHDSVALGAILGFALIVAYPERLAQVADLVRAARGKGEGTP